MAVHLSKQASGRFLVNDIASVYEMSANQQKAKFTSQSIEYVRNEKKP